MCFVCSCAAYVKQIHITISREYHTEALFGVAFKSVFLGDSYQRLLFSVSARAGLIASNYYRAIKCLNHSAEKCVLKISIYSGNPNPYVTCIPYICRPHISPFPLSYIVYNGFLWKVSIRALRELVKFGRQKK